MCVCVCVCVWRKGEKSSQIKQKSKCEFRTFY